jgi:hypothetical protein
MRWPLKLRPFLRVLKTHELRIIPEAKLGSAARGKKYTCSWKSLQTIWKEPKRCKSKSASDTRRSFLEIS